MSNAPKQTSTKGESLEEAERLAAALEFSTDDKWWKATSEAPGAIRFLIDEARRLRANHETADTVSRLHRANYRKALEGFLWLGDNLHNIKSDPDVFREMMEAALIDARKALNLEPI